MSICCSGLDRPHLNTKLVAVYVLCLLLLPLLTLSLRAQEEGNHAPVVTNVVAKQIEQRVEITYDLGDVDGDLMKVELLASSDGGNSFDLLVNSTEGDIGEGIASGKGKTIIWHVEQDVPDFYSTNVVFEVVAYDGVGPLIWEKDGSEMALIPAGTFEMGDSKNDPEDEMRYARPLHTVELDAFYMDRTEVTIGQFKDFLEATGYWLASEFQERNGSRPDDHPVAAIRWRDAVAYATWAGKRLPTEAEWEYAARGGLIGKRYPWGDDEDEINSYTNTSTSITLPVGSFEPNGYGLYDMTGNVWEWCSDWYREDYYSESPPKNPQGPEEGGDTQYPTHGRHVLRGGGLWGQDVLQQQCRVANRFIGLPPGPVYDSGGFRCVSGVKFNPGPSAGGGVTSGESARSNEAVPLPPANNGGVIEWEKDGSEMALIPAGSFQMGDHLDWMSNAPVHTVELNGFYMDVHEVTVGQFKQFVNQSGYSYDLWNQVAQYSPGDEYPMVYVNWDDAVAYAKWAGKRLPTEAEWEYASRGGLVGKRYPWGDEITHDDANYSGTGGKDKWSKCAPVGSFAPNGYGLYDMAGNAWEWCADRYDENYYQNSPSKNPPGPDTGSRRVLRGSCWYRTAYYLRVAYRGYDVPSNRYLYYGFRCVSGSN